MRFQNIFWCAIAIMLLTAVPIMAASERDRQIAATQSDIQAAITAMSAAERAGAPIYAKALHDEASARLKFAQTNAGADKASVRGKAQLAAIEARAAARAAEQKALWTAAVNEATAMRTDITTFGGTTPLLSLFVEPDAPVDRGQVSMSRVVTAEAAIARAKTAGVMAFAADEIRYAEATLESARKIVKNQKQNDSADYLAYMAEMTARRLEYQARLAEVDKLLPGLRIERSRLAKADSDRKAADEVARRQAAEAEAVALRSRLAEAERSRNAQRQELDAMRQQIATHHDELRRQLEADRAARLEAELRLSQLTGEYGRLAASGNEQQIADLQHQLSDQQQTVDTLRQRQSATEQTLRSEVDRLQQALADERARGSANADVIKQRQADIDAQRQQLDRLEAERVASEKTLAELRQQREQAAAQVAALQTQVAEEQQKSKQASAELQQTRTELSAERERARLQAELAKIAKTTSESRGLVVTLPGIYFDSSKSTLKPGARNILEKIAKQLEGKANLKVLVEGHTDSDGSEEMNQELSQKRADAVRDALAGFGIPADAISASGRGESAPVATNKTAAGRQENRRVELVIAN